MNPSMVSVSGAAEVISACDGVLAQGRPQEGLHFVPGDVTGLAYFLFVPTRVLSGRVLVSVHGISRNAREHIEMFKRMAQDHGALLVAPCFTAAEFPGYQRLGNKGVGPRADLALIRVLNDVHVRTACDTSRVDLFGFSGGAQFAHRFAFVHPQRVRRLSIGSAGWYTLPDPAYTYPYGVSDAKGLYGARLNLWAALRIRVLVLVGEQDNRVDDEELNQRPMVCRSQGPHRVARAETWVKAMNARALSAGQGGRVDLQLMPGVGHSFSQAVLVGQLDKAVFAHCYA